MDTIGVIAAFLDTYYVPGTTEEKVEADRLHDLLLFKLPQLSLSRASKIDELVITASRSLGWSDTGYRSTKRKKAKNKRIPPNRHYIGLRHRVPEWLCWQNSPSGCADETGSAPESSTAQCARFNNFANDQGWFIRTAPSAIPNAGDGMFATKTIRKRSYICSFTGTSVHQSLQRDVMNT